MFVNINVPRISVPKFSARWRPAESFHQSMPYPVGILSLSGNEKQAQAGNFLCSSALLTQSRVIARHSRCHYRCYPSRSQYRGSPPDYTIGLCYGAHAGCMVNSDVVCPGITHRKGEWLSLEGLTNRINSTIIISNTHPFIHLSFRSEGVLLILGAARISSGEISLSPLSSSRICGAVPVPVADDI